jgi:hypothetical protein
MIKVFIVFIIFFWGQLVFSQPYQSNYLIFVDYGDVIDMIKSSSKSMSSITDLDIESILLLDTADIKFVEKKYPRIVKIHRDNYKKDVIAEKCLPLKSKIIKDYFFNKELLNTLFNNTVEKGKDKTLDHTVYIKNNKRAIYRMAGDNWSECCRITITKKGLYIETLYVCQE